jgi:hypothetical protein
VQSSVSSDKYAHPAEQQRLAVVLALIRVLVHIGRQALHAKRCRCHNWMGYGAWADRERSGVTHAHRAFVLAEFINKHKAAVARPVPALVQLKPCRGTASASGLPLVNAGPALNGLAGAH